MWLVRIALSRPYTFVVIAILLVLFGVLAILRMPTDIFPAIDIPVVSVVWTYSEMPPQDMADRITTIFELAVTTTVDNIEHMESQSLLGVSVTKLYFQKGVDVALAIGQITAISQTMLKYLPPGITPPFVLSYDASTVSVLNVILSSDILPEQRLNDLANNFVRPQLATVQGAAIPYAFGGKSRMVMADLKNDTLQQYGLSAQNINTIMNLQSLIIPGGTEKIGKYEYIVQPNNCPIKIEEFNRFPVKTAPNVVIHMGEVAHVRDGFPPQTNIINLNGTRGVMIGIEKTGHASTLNIIQRVIDILPRVQAALPASLKVALTGNQGIFITAAIHGVLTEGLTAAGLTGLMILLFLGSLRCTLIVTTTIPLAVLTSLIILAALGHTINIMTLGGLALVVGILVDDATVAIENINWNLEQGKGLKDAILDGAKQIAIPAIVSTICICIVFLPMFDLSGVSKYLFVPMAEAVIFAMMASYLLSRTLLPTMAYYLLDSVRLHEDAIKQKPPSTFQRFHEAFNHKFECLRKSYGQHLEWALEHRNTFLSLFLGFVILSLAILWPSLGSDFFPKVDAGQILIHYSAHAGTRIEETAKIAARVNQIIRQVIPANELDNIVDNIGLPISGVNLTYVSSGTNGANDTDTYIALKKKHHHTEHYIGILREKLNKEIPGVTFSFLPADIVSQILNFGVPSELDIQITGLKEAENRKYANDLLASIKRIPGVVDARIRQSNQYPVLKLDVDRIRAAELGFSLGDIGSSLMVSLAGAFQTTPNFWVDESNHMSYQIQVQTPQYNIDTTNDLLNTPLMTLNMSANPQILGAVSKLNISATPLVVTHYNVQPAIDIFAGVDGRDLGSVASDLRRLLKQTEHHIPPGSQLFVRGQLATQESTFGTLYFGLILSVVLIYMVIVINFQSWLDPFIIITALPAALAGIAWMLFLTHTRLSVPALTGCIMSMGVATSNSILVVSFSRQNMADGMTPLKAALEAGSTRLRPVIMTAMAMTIGMLPMALGLGDGGEQNAPLGRAVIGGLSFATIATLFFVPTVFCSMHERKRQQQGLPDEV